MEKNIIQNALNKIKKDQKCKPKCIVIKGQKGPAGNAETIEIRNTTTLEPEEKAQVIDTKIDGHHILDFKIPKGIPGPAFKSAYLVTFNTKSDNVGLPIQSKAKIPISRKELDVNNIITLNTDNTIKFNDTGYYKISFTIFAYPSVNTPDFDPDRDIVSIGFKETTTDKTYVGGSAWVWNAEAIELYAQGIISVTDTNTLYELTNLSKETIYLNTPSINNISTTSYFINSLVTIIIDYIGKG